MAARILVVDDDVSVLLVLQQLLQRSGHECITAEDAATARRYLDHGKFDLLVTDILMPGESGLDLIQYVVRKHPDTPVVVVSAVEESEIAQQAIDLGVYGYIIKPFNNRSVLICITNALHRKNLEKRHAELIRNLEDLVEKRTAHLQKAIEGLNRMTVELRDSRELYRHLVTSLPIVVYRGYPDWTFELIDNKIEDLTGYAKEEFEDKGLQWSDLVVAEDIPRLKEITRRAIKHREAFIREYRIRHRDGRILWVQDHNQPIFDEQGWMTFIHGLIVDITEHKQAEIEREQTKNELQQLFNAISSILIGIDASNRVSRWNQVAEKTFAISADEVLGRSLLELDLSWDTRIVEEALEQCRSANRPHRVNDLPFIRSDGKNGFLGLTLNPIQCRKAFCNILIMGADITQQKLLESQLNQAQKLESIGQLAAGIAHEINTPTQYVSDNVHFLKDAFADLTDLIGKYRDVIEQVKSGEPVSESIEELEELEEEVDLQYLAQEVPAALDQSLEGLGRVARIVLAMKEFSHPGENQKQKVDINKALESTITVSRNEWKYVAEMKTEFDPQLPLVPCLPGEINQVFLNIIVNAAHAIADKIGSQPETKGLITINTGHDDNHCEIRISDTGKGIPEAIRHRIFDPFFTTKEVGKGTGQGLAISHDVVVNKHCGSIAVETETGQGTTFVIRLPLNDQSCDGESR